MKIDYSCLLIHIVKQVSLVSIYFMNNFLHLLRRQFVFYTTGEIFAFKKRYHDCWFMIRQEQYLKWMKKINSGIYLVNFISDDHPFVKCELGNYFDHLKGQQKLNV